MWFLSSLLISRLNSLVIPNMAAVCGVNNGSTINKLKSNDSAGVQFLIYEWFVFHDFVLKWTHACVVCSYT